MQHPARNRNADDSGADPNGVVVELQEQFAPRIVRLLGGDSGSPKGPRSTSRGTESRRGPERIRHVLQSLASYSCSPD
jgi:hypothetical protein